MTTGVKTGWDKMPKPPQKYNWASKLQKSQGKNIFKDKTAQIKHIFKGKNMTDIINKGYMKVLMNIPQAPLDIQRMNA